MEQGARSEDVFCGLEGVAGWSWRMASWHVTVSCPVRHIKKKKEFTPEWVERTSGKLACARGSVWDGMWGRKG